MASEMPELTLINILLTMVSFPLVAYGWGAGILGIKRTVGWAWRNIRVIPIGIFAIVIFLLAAAFIIWIGVIAGIIAAPYLLYKAHKTLRETEWVNDP
jgi:hypothetical protein